MAAMAAMAAMATLAAKAKMTLTIKNFLIYRRMFLNQVPQRTSIFTTSFLYVTTQFIVFNRYVMDGIICKNQCAT